MVDGFAALAGIPAGPRLAAALARIDVTRVPNNELLALLAAQSRQANHEAARLLGVIAEIGRATPTFDDDAVDRLDHPVPYAADEVRAALAWSRRAADRECDLAEQLVHDLPQVYAAFLAGDIDRSKVRVFADHLAGLTEAQIATVCAVLLPLAGRLTPGQLVARLRRLVAAIDPRHYERRYHKALRDRTVCAWLDENGTAVLCARGLSPAQAQAAVERIDLLAHAARRAGHPSTLDQIRVDILAGLLDGTLHHLTATRSSPICSPTVLATTTHHRPTPATTDLPTERHPATTRATDAGVVGASTPPVRATTNASASRCGWHCPPCSATTSNPARSPASARSPPPTPAPSSPANTAPSGATPSPTTSVGCCSTASPGGVPRGAPPPGHPAGSSSCTYLRRFSPPSRTAAKMRGLRWRAGRAYWPTSPASTANATGATSTPTPTTGYPAPRCAATPRSATARASASAAATAPPAATRTTPSTTGTAGPPSPPTWHRCAATTTPSKGKPVGPSDNRAPARSSGPAHSAGDTRSAPSPSCHRCPTPVPDPTTISMISRPHQHRISTHPCGRPTQPPSPPDGDAEPTDLDTPPPF